MKTSIFGYTRSLLIDTIVNQTCHSSDGGSLIITSTEWTDPSIFNRCVQSARVQEYIVKENINYNTRIN